MNETLFIPVIVGIVSALKIAGLPSRWAPLCSLAVGTTIFYFFSPVPGLDDILYGVIAGLSASGLYSGVKATLK